MSDTTRRSRPVVPRSSSARQALETLGDRLREIRVDAGLTGRDLARLASWHASKVSRIEHGRQAPSVDDVRTWCGHCRAENREADLVASLRAVDGMWTEWRRMERGGLRALQESLWPRYERTVRFHVYTSWLIPGLLQTEEYTRAVLSALAEDGGPDGDVEAAVALRMKRQQVLHQGGRQFSFLIEESVLRTGLGGVEVMAAQLGHLLVCAALPRISLGIVPAGPQRDAAMPVEGFHIFDEQLVSVELVSGYVRLTQPYDLALYARAFTELSRVAVFGAQARARITVAVDSYGATG